jgi:hypothetical protein
MQNFFSFSLVTLIFTILGRFEVQIVKPKLATIGEQEQGPCLLRTTGQSPPSCRPICLCAA